MHKPLQNSRNVEVKCVYDHKLNGTLKINHSYENTSRTDSTDLNLYAYTNNITSSQKSSLLLDENWVSNTLKSLTALVENRTRD